MSNAHRENKTDGYNRAIRDIQRMGRLYKAGLHEDGDELAQEVIGWLTSQVQLSEKMAKNGAKGGTAKATAKASAVATALAKSDFASTNKVINELIKEEVNTPPLNPPPGDLPPANKAIAEAWCEVAREFGYHFKPTSLAVSKGTRMLIRDGYTDPEVLKPWFNNFIGSGYPVKALDHFARNPVGYSKPQDHSRTTGNAQTPSQNGSQTGKKMTPEEFGSVWDDIEVNNGG